MRKRDLVIEFLQLITGFGKKAAPRFELGIKDLQSSALPLGHAAKIEIDPLSLDSISSSAQTLLVLSNGHGEDLIAFRVLEALHRLNPSLKLEVFPLVGEGKIFGIAIQEGWLRKIGFSRILPSGGFSNQSLTGLMNDLLAGLLKTTWYQWRCIQELSSKKILILAVGDLLPLFFAWSSGSIFGFIGTPKSDYTWRSTNRQSLSDIYHHLKRSEWDPWEWSLMRSNRCKLVAVRDKLTARGLRRHGVNALAPGNPMMDNFPCKDLPIELRKYRRILLLCGSRVPEALDNFKRLISASLLLPNSMPIAILVAIGSDLKYSQLQATLEDLGFSRSKNLDSEIGAMGTWKKGLINVLIGFDRFDEWVSWCEIGLATAGTATEQLVGLGIPALSLPGRGPQFTQSFALRQSRLLGGSVVPCYSPKQLARRLDLLLRDETLLQNMSVAGPKRMGSPGGSNALAILIAKQLFAA